MNTKKKVSKAKIKATSPFAHDKPIPVLSLRIWAVGLFAFACLLYANTLQHEYTQDDAIVIYDNMFTQEGISGISGLLKYDTFYGFFKEKGKAQLVSGGRYRPLTPVMFALEWQMFGRSPLVGHLINILLYGLLGVLLLFTLNRLLHLRHKEWAWVLAVMASFIYIAHPIHTEAVANIKGRDEIISMMGSIVSLLCVLKYVDQGHRKWLLWSGLSFFLACMSKENAVTFLAIIPLSLYFFRDKSWLQALGSTSTCMAAFVAFMMIRTAVLGLDFGGAPNEMMNNPFMKIVGTQYVPFSGAETFATILFTLGKYIQLLFFPHPLTHDYYPRHIEIMNFSDPSVWISMLMYLVLFALVVIGWKRKDIVTYGILFFLLTLTIVSNVVFPIGTNMSERFMFMPSLGFSLVMAYILYRCTYHRSPNLTAGVLALYLGLLSMKTIDRNKVWKDDFTLFTTDIHTSSNSAKLNNAVGGALSNAALKVEDEAERTSMLNESIMRLDAAIRIHPNYKNAHLIKGNCYHFLKQYPAAGQAYAKALQLDPGFKDAITNNAINDREQGRQRGEQGDLSAAKTFLNRSLSVMPQDYETLRLLGTANGFEGNVTSAIRYFEQAVAVQPNNADAYVNLGKAHANNGDQQKANEYFNQARQINPDAIK